MTKFGKALHLIGATMFFGSILSHITVGLVPGAQDDPQTAFIVREGIDAATIYLTIPGLILLVAAGVFMIVKGKLPVLKIRWLMLHAVFGLLIAFNGAVLLYPIGQNMLGIAGQVVSGAVSLDALHAPGGREAAFGAVNIVLCLAAIMLAVIKPRLKRADA
jgi:Predicted integral membrane protein (DUF2269)